MIFRVALAGLSMALTPIAAQAQTASSSPPPAVVVSTVTEQSPAALNRYVGRVIAVSTVELQVRVTGFLEKRNFTEGATVKKGDVLYEIEKDTYKANVDKSSATVQGAQATVTDDQKTFERMKFLRDKQDQPQSAVDQAEADLQNSQATLGEAKAQLELDQINLGYTTITSPIDGRISTTNINVGNLVTPDSGTLATILSVDPIYVRFYMSEAELVDARQKGLIGEDGAKLDVEITLSNGDVYPRKGKINYVGIAIEQSTDTAEIRATFDNPDGILIPGQFVTAKTMDPTAKPELAVPQLAVQLDKKGHFVFIVGDDNKVERQDVQVGAQQAGMWVVTSGLAKGQKVIVQGLQKVQPGIVVKPVEQQS